MAESVSPFSVTNSDGTETTPVECSQPVPAMTGVFADYEVGEFYDELFDPCGRPRRESETLFSYLQRMARDDLKRRQLAADRSMLRLGITFNVYGDGEGTERIIPFDIVPRVLRHGGVGSSSNGG